MAPATIRKTQALILPSMRQPASRLHNFRPRFESTTRLTHQRPSLSQCGATPMGISSGWFTANHMTTRTSKQTTRTSRVRDNMGSAYHRVDHRSRQHNWLSESRQQSTWGFLPASMGIARRDESCSPQPKEQRALWPPPQPGQSHLQSDPSWVEDVAVPSGMQVSALGNDSTAGTLNVTELC
jgi:hypothetical protein